MISTIAIHLDVPLWWVYNHHKGEWTGPVKVCEAVAMSGIRPIALTNPGPDEGGRRWLEEGYAHRDLHMRLKLIERLRTKEKP